MGKVKYHDREWLTDLGSPSTPSITTFSGPVLWDSEDEAPEDHDKIEIASCSKKVTLHRTPDQSEEDWHRQVGKLYNHIGRYLRFLET